MTDRIKGFTVVLKKDMRDDDVEDIRNAMSMIKGISSVSDSVSVPEDYIAVERTKVHIRAKLYDFIQNNL